MSDYTELARLSMRMVAEMLLKYEDPGSRDAYVHEAIDDLDVADTLQVTGMIISQLCDMIDGIGEHPEMRRRLDESMKNLLLELDVTDGIPGRQ